MPCQRLLLERLLLERPLERRKGGGIARARAAASARESKVTRGKTFSFIEPPTLRMTRKRVPRLSRLMVMPGGRGDGPEPWEEVRGVRG